jgi:hypothetical protein
MPGLLRIHGHAERRVDDVVSFLRSLEHAYCGAYIFFDLLVDDEARFRRGFVPLPWRWTHPSFPRVAPRDFAMFVKPDDQLVLRAARLSSPGAWEFLAKLNPLEVVRHYLAERHERRKDKEYRERAEDKRLSLENSLLENRVIRERIEIARSMGATDADLIPLLNEFIHQPLRELGKHQDSGLIDGAEIKQLASGAKDPGPEPEG